jgi:hypothetical protein
MAHATRCRSYPGLATSDSVQLYWDLYGKSTDGIENGFRVWRTRLLTWVWNPAPTGRGVEQAMAARRRGDDERKRRAWLRPFEIYWSDRAVSWQTRFQIRTDPGAVPFVSSFLFLLDNSVFIVAASRHPPGSPRPHASSLTSPRVNFSMKKHDTLDVERLKMEDS